MRWTALVVASDIALTVPFFNEVAIEVVLIDSLGVVAVFAYLA